MTKDLRRAFQFFHANAGGVVGRMAIGAMALARAEQWAQDNDLEFQWEWEDWGGDDFICNRCDHIKECSQRYRGNYFGCQHVGTHDHEVTWVRVELDGMQECLGGIVDADRNYRRVIEAELAAELRYRWEGTLRMYSEAWAD